MSHRFKLYAVAFATAGLLIALAGAGAAETAHPKKDHAPKAPQLHEQLPEVYYIRCATSLGDGPCSPDPSMQRLNGDPPFERPRLVPQPDAPDAPDAPNFAPAR
jgi:hypothetical protein